MNMFNNIPGTGLQRISLSFSCNTATKPMESRQKQQ